MIRFLAGKFLPPGDPNDPAVRSAYGTLCGMVGIVLNLLLFVGKLLAGLFSGSIAVVADAVNNLSDAGSSIITLAGFRMASKKPDPDHPFGHGRMEYLSGLMVSAAILVMGVELGISSVKKILDGASAEFSLLSAVILAVSILIKLYMWSYNRSVGRKIDSAAMRATARDSLSDAAATTAVLLSLVVAHFTSWNIDGWVGAAVSLLILFAGLSSIKETVDPLLGSPPSPDVIRTIREVIHCHPEAMGIHDIIVHDYGPGRMMVSLHVEVPGDQDIFALHDAIDHMENKLRDTLHCDAIIHMDPVVVDDERVKDAKRRVTEAVCSVDPALSIHDFRMVAGPTHTNVIFDVLAPFSFKYTDEEISLKVRESVQAMDPTWFAVIKVDKDYLGEHT